MVTESPSPARPGKGLLGGERPCRAELSALNQEAERQDVRLPQGGDRRRWGERSSLAQDGGNRSQHRWLQARLLQQSIELAECLGRERGCRRSWLGIGNRGSEVLDFLGRRVFCFVRLFQSSTRKDRDCDGRCLVSPGQLTWLWPQPGVWPVPGSGGRLRAREP